MSNNDTARLQRATGAKMKMITFINTFHNSSARKRLNDGDIASNREVLAMQRKLCGVAGCQCGGNGGVRGGEWRLDPWEPNGDCIVTRAN